MSDNLDLYEMNGRVGIIVVSRPDTMTARIPLVLDNDDAHECCAMFFEKRRADFSGR